jgi:hypothetical protein
MQMLGGRDGDSGGGSQSEDSGFRDSPQKSREKATSVADDGFVDDDIPF